MNIREQWQNLSLREKQTVFAGSVAIAIFLFSELIWSPLANQVTSLRSQVTSNQKLLSWMKTADARLAALSDSTEKKSAQSASLLSIMQTQIKTSPFASHATQLRQVESNTVQLNLNKVGFDALTTWLTTLWKDSGVLVGQITVTPTGAVGEVNVELVLKSG